MDDTSYDAIIVGASFAGLAVANQLQGRHILLIDQKYPGTGQTSACGTILQVLRYWGLLDSVVQTHDQLILHTAQDDHPFPSPYTWCTFDYRQVCETLFERSQAEFLEIAVHGTDGERVYTSEGELRARCIIDASGWRAVLAESLHPGYAKTAAMNFGIETVVKPPWDIDIDTGSLHFVYDPAILTHGVGWVFPRGDVVSFGIGSYRGARRMRAPLDQLATRIGLKRNELHGTYFPYVLRSANIGQIFVVGDAAGMCIGLTGEGIRPALFFGEACGKIVRRFLDGAITLEGGFSEYTAFVNSRRPFFRLFSFLQRFLTRLPVKWIDNFADLIRNERVLSWVLNKYWSLTEVWGMP